MILSSGFPENLRRVVCAVAAALCLFTAARAQSQQEQDDTVTVNTNLVILNVGVADRKGQPVTDLSRTDFNVYEDGVKQSIVSFEPVNSPFSLVLLLDVSG